MSHQPEQTIPTTEKEKLIPKELTSKQDLKDFWLAFRDRMGWKQDKAGWEKDDPAEEQRIAAEVAERSIDEQKENKYPDQYYGIRDEKGEMFATGKLEFNMQEDGKHGYLGLLTVREDHEGEERAKQLTDIRTKAAIEAECVCLDASVNTDNPTALVVKFKEGYCLSDFEAHPENPKKTWFNLHKRLDEEPKYGKSKDLEKIPLTDLKTIQNFLNKDYVGINLNSLGDRKNTDPENWELVMEKVGK